MCAESIGRLCECGCGEPAPIATMTNRSRGAVKGEPLRFCHGHNGRGTPAQRAERFWAKVDRTGGCWLWTGYINSETGYGHVTVCGQHLVAHRVAYEMLVGPIPAGLDLDHLCHGPDCAGGMCLHRRCVNPAHLEPVTRGENLRRGNGWSGRHARASLCPHGHPYDEANTICLPKGGRACRECKRLINAKRDRKVRPSGEAR